MVHAMRLRGGGGTSYESREPKTSIWGENMDSKPQNQIQAV